MAINFSTISAVKMPVKTWGAGQDVESLSQSLTETWPWDFPLNLLVEL